MTRPSITEAVTHAAQGLFFIVLAAVAVRVFLALFAPRPHEPAPQPFTGYDRSGMQASMTPAAVRSELDTVAGIGDRFIGSDGFYRCEEWLRTRYREAGLRILEQSIRVAAPQTETAEVVLADGTPAPFRIYPFMPNHFQPVATPDEGVTGVLLKIDAELLRQRPSFQGCLALLDASRPPPSGFGYHYARYAQLGFEGVVVSHTNGLDQIEWSELDDMVTSNPIQYLRVAADPDVFRFTNQTMTLRVRSPYRNVPNRTLVGVLEAGQPAAEALVIPCSYDAVSMLPDRSPGLFDALSVAVHLRLLDGIRPYQPQLRRDVIFIAFGGHVMAHDAQNQFLHALGSVDGHEARRTYLQERQQTEQAMAASVEAVLASLSDPAFLDLPNPTLQAMGGWSRAARDCFDEQYQYVLNTLVFELSEDLLQAKIEFEKGDVVDTSGPAFAAYQSVKRTYDQAFSCAGYPVGKLLNAQPAFVRTRAIRDRVARRFEALSAHHAEQARWLAESLALNDRFRRYSSLVVLAPQLTVAPGRPDTETLSFTMGHKIPHTTHGQAAKDVLLGAINRLGLSDRVKVEFGDARQHGEMMYGKLSGMIPEAQPWANAAYPAYSLVNLDRSYKSTGYPVELPPMRNTESIAGSLQVVGEAVLSVAFGNGQFNSLRHPALPDYRGRVFVANVGQSIIPNYPLEHALMASKEWKPKNGYFPYLMFFADPYGRYDRRACTATFSLTQWGFGVDAAGYDAGGRLRFIKDEGLSAQRLYKSAGLGPGNLSQGINVVCYRADPVSILDLINPQSLKNYTGIEMVDPKSLSPFERVYHVYVDGLFTTFIKPDAYFYVKLKAGSEENELVQTTRAFLLGLPLRDVEQAAAAEDADIRMGNDIRGRGYLAAETPLLLNPPMEAAKSMAFVNTQRLHVQRKYNMADERTLTFQKQAMEGLRAATKDGIPYHEAVMEAREAVTYSTLNYPIIRRSIFEAVAGILWYLGLLVPFAFFFEKLMFGYTDIRKQLAANAVIFLVVFGLLRLLHPAFAMIRSSLMILLGFVIFLIAGGIIFLFSSKFRENLEGIRKQRGQVDEAEANKYGVVATAFMLGLNNMHRRRLRTLLTCGTLVLLTFVMICFTSMRSDLVETAQALGKAPYQGFVVQTEEFRPMSPSELFTLQTRYGDDCKVCPRRMMIGVEEWTNRQRYYPQVELRRRVGDKVYNAFPHSVLTWSADEPLARRLSIVGRWFTPEDSATTGADVPILVSSAIARRLNIDPRELEQAGEVPVDIGGERFRVCGSFDGAELDELLDVDGHNLLPFDIKALREVKQTWIGQTPQVLADADAPRIRGENVIVAAQPMKATIPHGQDRIVSVAIVLPETLSYKEAKAYIERYMEQSGRTTHYGLDGYAFVGKRARESTFVGLLDMLIPLIIAAITVLNTIRGSVYERKDEIFVYNAVGIAPRQVFFMFFAEAFVYAVVGCVLGYILSQGTGRLLTALNLTGGLNMNFTSLGSIYASLTITAAVLLSTWFPARTAMRIASPSDDPGWRLPEPDGDCLRFRLPFTFDYRDRIAVLVFFDRYLSDHGEGSSGAFFTGHPEIGLSARTDPMDAGACIPAITAPVWLKPFDLGVSQQLAIELPRDPETGEYVAEIVLTRWSGTLESWRRLNNVFVGLVRRHFLHWRAVKAQERADLFEEAVARLRGLAGTQAREEDGHGSTEAG